MGQYQQFRGNPENKLFYLLNSFMGGINTEFSDDSSNDVDFESIINFDMDKLGTLNKRGGFGELTAISEIFNKLDVENELPNIKNRTETKPNPENENDNVVYMKLLRNDNNCFRALSGFSGRNAYRKYQEMYGFQKNRFVLLMITTKMEDGVESSSNAWLYQCYLPELEYDTNNEPTSTETMVISCNKITLPVVFKWDRNLMNIDTIEFYDKIYFTGNDKCLVTFDRSLPITSNSDLEDAFTYSGYSFPNLTNNAHVPSGLEIRHVGFNVLCEDPMHSIDTQGISTDSIQGLFVCTLDNKPLQSLPLGQKFLLNIIYTGQDNGFTIELKEGTNTLSFELLANATLSAPGLKVYEVTFKDVPSKEVEIKIEKTNAQLEPYYDYYDVAQVDSEAKTIEQLNIGDYGICEMYSRAVFYKDDTIWFSELNNFRYIPNYNYVTLPIEPTDKITKICYFKKAYIIFTKQRIYKMTGAFGTSEFAVSPVNMSLGCHAGNTVVPIEDTLYFSSPRGLYALRSSTFVEGYENVKELDLKVKTLTSDFTKYDEELTNPAVRFNGVSERAYALRYKDKYLLFYNNYNDKGDYAAVNDLDVLAYQFDIGAYTTYRFKEKPTFLFIVDNAIETLATVAQKEIFTDEEVLFDYDLTQINGNIIEDRSESGNDATFVGDLTINQGIGVDLEGTNSYIQINGLNEDIREGFDITIDTKLNELTGTTLVHLQKTMSLPVSESGEIVTNIANNFGARLEYTINKNASTGNDTVDYRLYYLRTNDSPSTGELTYSLNDLIPSKTVNYDLSNSTSDLVDSGTFKISRDKDFNYSSVWNLQVNSTYTSIETSTTQVLGADVNLTNKFYDTSKSWIKLGFSSFKAKATTTGCTITYTPAVKNTATLNVGSRDLTVTINGTKYKHSVGSISSTGTHKANAKTITLKYTGKKTISVSMTYAIKATLSGTYTANLSTKSATKITLPSVTNTTTETTTIIPFTLTGNKSINLSRATNNTFPITLKQNGNLDQLLFTMSNENETINILTDEGIGLASRHIWRIAVARGETNFTCTIYRDDEAIKSVEISGDFVVSTNRNDFFLGTDKAQTSYMNGEIYGFSMSNISGILLDYTFSEGTGTLITSNSSNKTTGRLIGNIEWITAQGLVFNGTNSYVQLPEFDETYFSNGFKLEFTGIIGSNPNASRILDLATSYNNDNAKNKKCSINIGVKGNMLTFNTTSSDFITYRITDNTIDFSESHHYVIDCVNNGKGYTISLIVDGVTLSITNFNTGGITDIKRASNFIGKSNTTTEALFRGVLTSFKATVYASTSGVSMYRSALYEFDTTSTDFGRPMYIELKTKGINMKYPQHLKKLKHIFVKAIGGYTYGELFFTLYGDGYVVNDARIYDYSIEEETGTVIQEYRDIKNLTLDERVSLLGNMRLDYTKLGNGKYQTRKLIIPKKARNFAIHVYGESSDYISIESFGFVCKLGKVKEG